VDKNVPPFIARRQPVETVVVSPYENFLLSEAVIEAEMEARKPKEENKETQLPAMQGDNDEETEQVGSISCPEYSLQVLAESERTCWSRQLRCRTLRCI
jgi:hypothetical protein